LTAHPALASAWDLTALLNAADASASRPLRHLWLVRLIEWLRHGSIEAEPGNTPRPVLRIRHLLNVLERNEEPRQRIVALLASFWQHTDLAALLADFGFSARRDLWGELRERLALRLLPATPDTDDGAILFGLLFTRDDDADWLGAIDPATLARLAALFRQAQAQQEPHDHLAWRAPVLQAMTWLASAVRAAAFAPELRRRMSPALLTTRPFDQLARAQDALADALQAGPREAAAPQATYLRALLQGCREAADSVHAHLASHGVSVDIMFELEQLQARSLRLESMLDLVLSNKPQRELQRLMVTLVGVSRERRSLRGLLQRQYALMARKVAERHAETGEHYITRNWGEYRQMLGRAAGGGAIIGGTTLLKFGLLTLALAPFWSGLAAGLNYAISFVIVQLLHWTVATKQPAT
jgi:site-specific recombinase